MHFGIYMSYTVNLFISKVPKMNLTAHPTHWTLRHGELWKDSKIIFKTFFCLIVLGGFFGT